MRETLAVFAGMAVVAVGVFMFINSIAIYWWATKQAWGL